MTTTTAQTETHFRQFLKERFPSTNGDVAEAAYEDGNGITCEQDYNVAQNNSSNNDDDNSSVAMDKFLKSRMDAAFRSSTSSYDHDYDSSSSSSPTTRERITQHPQHNNNNDDDDNSSSSSQSWQDIPVTKNPTFQSKNKEVASSALSGTTNSSNTQQQEQQQHIQSPAALEEEEDTTAASSSHTPPDLFPLPSTPILYNPFSNYSPAAHAPRKEIMGMSIPVFSSASPSSFYHPRVEVEAEPTPPMVPSPYARISRRNRLNNDDDDDGDNSSTDSDSDDALEKWARQIRVELRHAEMVDLAVEAERAAESGIESFAAKLSTYGSGQDDSLLIPSAFKKTNNSPQYTRRKSFSEGTKIPILPRRSRRRSRYAPRIGVMDLREVEEVFPSFNQFHSHLRTHFVRNHVDDRTLSFKESKRAAHNKLRWGGVGSSSSSISTNHSRPPSDLLQHTRSPSDFFKHPRSPSDFFKPHPRSRSDLFKHHRTPSDFFQNLFIGTALSTDDTVDESEVVNILADHIADESRRRKLPKVVVPNGLELPNLALDRRSPPIREKKTPSEQTKNETEPASLSSKPNRRRSSTSKHHLSPKALFDQDDGLESDAESPPGSPKITADGGKDIIPPPPPPPPQGVETPVDRSSHFSKSGPDFVTPARLRVIRNRSQGLELEAHAGDQNLFLTPNSAIETARSESGLPDLEYRKLPPALEDNASSILLPEKLGGTSTERLGLGLSEKRQPMINVGFKPRPSEPSADACIASRDRLLDDFPLYQEGSKSSLSIRLSPVKQVEESCSDLPVEDPKTPERRDLDDSGIAEGVDPPTSESNNPSETKSRRRRVKVSIYGNGPSSEGPSAISGVGIGGVLQHSQTIALAESDDARETPEASTIAVESINADCACLALSAPCSPESMCSSAPSVDDDGKAPIKASILTRSSSTGALSSLDTGRQANWNPFAVKCQDGKKSSTKQPFQAAMDMFHSISPKKRGKTLYIPPDENEDFLHNYLYCSKPPKVADSNHSVCEKEACVDVSSDMCCTSILPDNSFFGPLLSNNNVRRSTAGPLLSLSGDKYSRVEPETWFDLANERFDGVLEKWAGRNKRNHNNLNVSFQAPTLRKNSDLPNQKDRAYSIAEEGDIADEKKSETDHDGNSTDSSSAGSKQKHVRHLSYFPSEGSQFEVIYGLSREALADSLARNIEAYQQEDPNESFSGTTSSQDNTDKYPFDTKEETICSVASDPTPAGKGNQSPMYDVNPLGGNPTF